MNDGRSRALRARIRGRAPSAAFAESLPEYVGVAKKVMDELNARIGYDSLDFDDIARTLCFSRRTLQRRLQAQGLCFAVLRDTVRRHHAMKLLLDEGAKVDDIFTALDFADRSSLNLAFKRWTGVSPRGFLRRCREELCEKREALCEKGTEVSLLDD